MNKSNIKLHQMMLLKKSRGESSENGVGYGDILNFKGHE